MTLPPRVVTLEEYEAMQKRLAHRKSQARTAVNSTPEEAAMAREAKRLAMAKYRALMIPEDRAADLAKRREAGKAARQAETAEQAEARRAAQRERARRHRLSSRTDP